MTRRSHHAPPPSPRITTPTRSAASPRRCSTCTPSGCRPTRARPTQRKRRRIQRPAAEPEGPGADWPLAPASPSPASWPEAAPSSPAPRPPPKPQPSPASLAQRDALRAVEEFFSGRGSSDEDGEDEGSEPEDGGDATTGFFLGLFKRDAALRSTTSGATRRASTSCTTPATPSTAGGCWRTARSSPSSAACSAGTSNGCPASSSIPAARSARPSSSGCKIASPTSEFYLPCDDKQRKILMD
ncbi:putative protein TPRXL [Hordeum vulgare subsp. vulgare]|uniref:putative protein TPRXL n=1 Tax=Hordeum vulgare subsp. vulgare TaxID=112509 RepID=UPI001D1A35D5|nr:putative protein TPRXL [Hordeum vulgare subsp. vulgare]